MIGEFNHLIQIIENTLVGIGIESWITQLICSILALIFCLVILTYYFRKFLLYCLRVIRNIKLKQDLHPFYTKREIQNATKYFINTKFQNLPPSEDEEPNKNYVAAAKENLIPLFINKLFNKKLGDNKYFLILADSGMGKTTFMINLYLKYKYRFTWPWKIKYNVILLPLGNPESITKLKELSTKEKERSIILLDAFDEDNEAVEDYEKRLKEIVDLVWNFREVVITCRTQFFPSAQDEPTDTGRFKFGPQGGEYQFQKLFISTFSDKDIKKYLKKKYRTFIFLRGSKHLRALAIVLKSPKLMMRPMLLSHIDDLVMSDMKLKYGYQVYEALINQWLNRESNKSSIRSKYGNSYKELLYNFSLSLAIHLYRSKKLTISNEELIQNENGLQIKDIEGNQIQISKHEQSSRSLLNRNAIGEYKFSHKSIYEYFLAVALFKIPEFRNELKITYDLESTKFFLREMLSHTGTRFGNPVLKKLGFERDEIKTIYKNEIDDDRLDEIIEKLYSSTFKHSLLTILFVFPFVYFCFKYLIDTESFTNYAEAFRIGISILAAAGVFINAYLTYLRVKNKISKRYE